MDFVPHAEAEGNVKLLYKILTLACLTHSWLNFNFQNGAFQMFHENGRRGRGTGRKVKGCAPTLGPSL